MFEKRYEPRIKGDKITITDKRFKDIWQYLLFITIFMVLVLPFMFNADDSITERIVGSALIGIMFFWSFVLIIGSAERRYIIWPSSISVAYMYGIITKKIDFHMVTCCIHHSGYIIVIGNKGREIKIECCYLSSDAEKTLLDFFDKNHISVRRITPNSRKTDITNFNYIFKMKQNGICFLAICLAFISAFIDYVLWEDAIVNEIFCFSFTGIAALSICLLLLNTYSVYVTGEVIEIRRWLKKTKVINVKDISFAQTELVTHYHKYGKRVLEEMKVYAKNDLNNALIHVGEWYKDYYVFKLYLNDNGVSFSKEGSKKPVLKKGNNINTLSKGK